MQKIKKFKSEIAQFSQNKANFPPFFLLTFSSGGILPPQIPPFLLSSRGTLSIVGTMVSKYVLSYRSAVLVILYVFTIFSLTK